MEAVRLQHKKTLRSTLHVWLDAFPDDFRDPPDYPLLNQFLVFCEQHAKDSELHFKVKHRMERLIKNPEPIDQSPSIQRILATNPDLTYSGNDTNGGSSVNGICNSGDHTADASLHAIFLELPEKHMAEQLTRLDTELFKRVIPHQCLGAVWSRRDRDKGKIGKGTRSSEASSVAATVEQFNAVSYRVISTILVGSTEPRSQQRARVIAKWIDVAQELRVLKNFSSLKAIISALQSNPIYRLKHVWANVPRDKVEVYEELARIFSEENNQSAQRELLMKEGTAKFAETAGENDRQMLKVIQKQAVHSNLISHGTIPYLGTFLTDLTMVDTAIPDTTADGLINFDKRRKEFEVLAQIKLLQGAANSYQIATDHRFERWFESLMVLDDREAYELSCNLEPCNSGHSSARNSEKFPRRKPNGYGHRKNDSIASTSSSSSSQFLSELDGANSANLSLGESSASLEQKMFHTHLSSSSSSSSLPSLDVSVSSSGGGTTGLSVGTHSSSQNATPSKAGSLPRGVTPPYSVSPMRTPDFYVIRVSIASPSKETEGINLYKSIMVSNHERSPQVIRNAMVKHGLEGNPEDYTLAQLLPKGEMVLPSNANVYYAINTSCDLNFILRPRGESMGHNHHSTPPGSGSASGRSTPTRLRMRECHKDSSTKDTLKARKKILSLGL
ncbi:ral guanine nucleotide dissociation stimulator-like 1 isoform X2 [Daphnia magna]|nr:ral guanine nucleotide dissociation stimulator-like 1 isoform X2 [Daphnia magna]